MLALYAPNQREELRCLNFYWLRTNEQRTMNLELWNSRGDSAAEDVVRLELTAETLGSGNRLGEEIVNEQWISCKLSTDESFTAIGNGSNFLVGSIPANDSVEVQFRVDVPSSPTTLGLAHVRLGISTLALSDSGCPNAFIHGEHLYGTRIYADAIEERDRRFRYILDNMLIRLVIFNNSLKSAYEAAGVDWGD